MKSPRRILFVTAAVAALALQPFAARAELLTISDMFVFGDSLSDGGNSGLLTQAAATVVVFPPAALRRRAILERPHGRRTALEPVQHRWRAAALARRRHEFRDRRRDDRSRELQRDQRAACRMRCIPSFAERGAAWQLEQFQAYAASNSFDPATSLIRRLAVPERRLLREHHRHAARRRPGFARRRQRGRERHRQHPDHHPDPGRGRRAAFPRAEPGQPRRHAGLRRRPACRRLERTDDRVQHQPGDAARAARCDRSPPRSRCSTPMPLFQRAACGPRRVRYHEHDGAVRATSPRTRSVQTRTSTCSGTACTRPRARTKSSRGNSGAH